MAEDLDSGFKAMPVTLHVGTTQVSLSDTSQRKVLPFFHSKILQSDPEL